SCVPRENLSIEVLADDCLVRGLQDRRKMRERALEIRRRRSNAGGQVSLEHGIQLSLPRWLVGPVLPGRPALARRGAPLRARENTPGPDLSDRSTGLAPCPSSLGSDRLPVSFRPERTPRLA